MEQQTNKGIKKIYEYLFPAQYGRERYLLLFVTGMAVMLLCALPSLIINKGIFIYYGDFNSQQEMFYYHSNEMVKNGNFGWDWGTDLGSSFIGSYSFYLLGSPFFWFTTIFPPSWEVYMIPLMLGVKTGCAAMFAYAYIRLFTKNRDAAFIGGLLYACSGFQAYNVFFNHFHDATALFPLLLIAFELNIRKNSRGAFALAVMINAMNSYFFFFGEVVFVIIYFFVRLFSGDIDINLKKLINLVFESVLGVLLAAVIFLPACLDTINNPRLSNHLWGLNLVGYSDKFRILRIIQSFFMLPDMPARVNLLHGDGAAEKDTARWASIAGYLPLFSMTGVIAFIRTKKKSWQTRLFFVCAVMAMIPGLNAVYAMMNSSYYARWYYMPILIMAMMTSKVLEENPQEVKRAFLPVTLITAAFCVVGLLPVKSGEKIKWLEIPRYKELYYIQAGGAVVLTAALAILIYRYSKREDFLRVACFFTTGACAASMAVCVWYGVCQGPYNDYYIEHAIRGGENIDLTEFETEEETNAGNSFYRIDTSPNVDNWCMFWGLSSMRCFQSVVPDSIMRFYETMHLDRNVASRIDTKYYGFRGLLSVKYYFEECVDNYSSGEDAVKEAKESLDNMPSFKYVGTQNGFNIYKNEYYVPMGFTYDSYLTKEEFEKQSNVRQPNLLMHALVLDDEDINKNSDILEHFKIEGKDVTRINYEQTCREKSESACDTFEYDTNGFKATNTLEKESMVFFSVPYTEGWSAKVNGEDAEIVRASYGFMAVRCKAGDNSIEFRYETPGLKAGIIISGISAVVLIGYVVYYRKKEKAEKVK